MSKEVSRQERNAVAEKTAMSIYAAQKTTAEATGLYTIDGALPLTIGLAGFNLKSGAQTSFEFFMLSSVEYRAFYDKPYDPNATAVAAACVRTTYGDIITDLRDEDGNKLSCDTCKFTLYEKGVPYCRVRVYLIGIGKVDGEFRPVIIDTTKNFANAITRGIVKNPIRQGENRVHLLRLRDKTINVEYAAVTPEEMQIVEHLGTRTFDANKLEEHTINKATQREDF